MPDHSILPEEFSSAVAKALAELKESLAPKQVDVELKNQLLICSTSHRRFTAQLMFGTALTRHEKADVLLPLDYLIRHPSLAGAMVQNKLRLNTTVYARNCNCIRISKMIARDFLNACHFMGATQSAYNFALSRSNKLLAVASFSKGRKMRRLKENQRSFELIRFCVAPGYSVSGGLSKIMATFCEAKKAAEVMTYVDKQFSNGEAFIKAGFRMWQDTPPQLFLVNRRNFRRQIFSDHENPDLKNFYLCNNAGNLKLIFDCIKK